MLLLQNNKVIQEELRSLEKQCARELSLCPSCKHFVMISYHYGSFTMGILALRTFGIPVYVLGSEIVESDSLPSSLQKFFRRKYKIMSEYLNGGGILFREKRKLEYFKKLRWGAIGVVLADLLASVNNSSIEIEIFGVRTKIQSGVALFAQRNKIPLGAFLCYRNTLGEIKMGMSSLTKSKENLSILVHRLFEEIKQKGSFSKRHWLIADSFNNH